jgi:hypothetical protein
MDYPHKVSSRIRFIPWKIPKSANPKETAEVPYPRQEVTYESATEANESAPSFRNRTNACYFWSNGYFYRPGMDRNHSSRGRNRRGSKRNPALSGIENVVYKPTAIKESKLTRYSIGVSLLSYLQAGDGSQSYSTVIFNQCDFSFFNPKYGISI